MDNFVKVIPTPAMRIKIPALWSVVVDEYNAFNYKDEKHWKEVEYKGFWTLWLWTKKSKDFVKPDVKCKDFWYIHSYYDIDDRLRVHRCTTDLGDDLMTLNQMAKSTQSKEWFLSPTCTTLLTDIMNDKYKELTK